MSVTLLDIARSTQDPMASGIISTVIETSYLMSQMPVETEPMMTRKATREGKLPQAGFRANGEAFSDNEKTTYNDYTVDLQPFGLNIGLDRKSKKIQTLSGRSVEAQQIESAVRGMSLDLKKQIMKSQRASGKGFDGLQYIIEQGPSSQKISYEAAANGSQLTDGAKLVDNFDQLISAVGTPDVLISSEQTIREARALSMAATANNPLLGMIEWETVTIDGPNGEPMRYRVATYNGIPWLPAGYDSQRSNVLDYDESQGSSSVTASVYAIRFGAGGLKLLVDQEEPEVDLVKDTSGHTAVIDWAVAPFVDDPYSIARLNGILAS